MTIHLRVSKARLTVGDVIKAEAGIKSTAEMVDFLAKFVTDDAGQYLPTEQAHEALLELTLDELPGVVADMTEGIKSLTAAAVPLARNASL